MGIVVQHNWHQSKGDLETGKSKGPLFNLLCDGFQDGVNKIHLSSKKGLGAGLLGENLKVGLGICVVVTRKPRLQTRSKRNLDQTGFLGLGTKQLFF